MHAPAAGYIHPTAITEGAHLGPGTRVWAHVHLLPGVRVGRDGNIGDGAFIESGVEIGDGVTIKNQALIWSGVRIADYVFIGPGVVFTNDRYPRSPRLPGMEGRYAQLETWCVPTQVCEGVSIGAQATIVCGVTLGRFASVAAGSVVTRDVPPYHLVAGNPARVIGRVNREGAVLRADGTDWLEPCTGTRYRFVNEEMTEVT